MSYMQDIYLATYYAQNSHLFLSVDQLNGKPTALSNMVYSHHWYQICINNCNTQKQPTMHRLQTNKQITTRRKSATKSENHDKHNTHVIIQVCYTKPTVFV